MKELRVRSLCLSLVTLVLVLSVDGDDSYNTPAHIWLENLGGITLMKVFRKTIHEYAVNELCNTQRGRDIFLKKLTESLCGFDDEFVEAFMFDLCYNRGDTLERWVSRLFDTDKNTYINFFERMYMN